MKQLEEIVWTFPNLIALIVGRYGTSLEEVGKIDYNGNHYIIDDNYPFDGSYIIIWNKHSVNKIKSNSKSKIIRAFEKEVSKEI